MKSLLADCDDVRSLLAGCDDAATACGSVPGVKNSSTSSSSLLLFATNVGGGGCCPGGSFDWSGSSGVGAVGAVLFAAEDVGDGGTDDDSGGADVSVDGGILVVPKYSGLSGVLNMEIGCLVGDGIGVSSRGGCDVGTGVAKIVTAGVDDDAVVAAENSTGGDRGALVPPLCFILATVSFMAASFAALAIAKNCLLFFCNKWQ